MNEQTYFEQFVGDMIEIEIIHIPISLTEFQGFDELQQASLIAIAKTYMIPMHVWREYQSD